MARKLLLKMEKKKLSTKKINTIKENGHEALFNIYSR